MKLIKKEFTLHKEKVNITLHFVQNFILDYLCSVDMPLSIAFFSEISFGTTLHI